MGRGIRYMGSFAKRDWTSCSSTWACSGLNIVDSTPFESRRKRIALNSVPCLYSCQDPLILRSTFSWAGSRWECHLNPQSLWGGAWEATLSFYCLWCEEQGKEGKAGGSKMRALSFSFIPIRFSHKCLSIATMHCPKVVLIQLHDCVIFWNHGTKEPSRKWLVPGPWHLSVEVQKKNVRL